MQVVVPRNAPDVISEANLAHAARKWGPEKASAAKKPRSEPEERCLPGASMSGMTEPADWVPPHNRGLGDMNVCILFAADVKSQSPPMNHFGRDARVTSAWLQDASGESQVAIDAEFL